MTARSSLRGKRWPLHLVAQLTEEDQRGRERLRKGGDGGWKLAIFLHIS
jgi:hypothetical protein